MTTGRINQVTTLHMRRGNKAHLTIRRVLAHTVLSAAGVRYKALKASICLTIGK
ncbi:hypothetical protein NEUTE2DRAFT_170563 [Neurospora tetrasperma FGSC 2509]|nr:hypothetical protein NEUTE2DRAFT_170563 [Neurospora tetrasperma FGSC 2509]